MSIPGLRWPGRSGRNRSSSLTMTSSTGAWTGMRRPSSLTPSPRQIRGEKSVGYLESAVAADRIVATLPHARIVAILRDPIERAVSNYRFSVANGLEDRSIEAALGADPPEVEHDGGWFVVGDRRIAANPFDYRRRGHYVEDLRRYAASFGRERMHVMVFEDAVGSAGGIGSAVRIPRRRSGVRSRSSCHGLQCHCGRTEPTRRGASERTRRLLRATERGARCWIRLGPQLVGGWSLID